MAKLGDIFTLQMGKTPARANEDYWNNGNNPWVSISDLSTYDKYVSGTKELITDDAVFDSGIKIVPENTVIMSFKLSIGKVAITKSPIYTNEAIMAFIPNGKIEILPDYLYYLFLAKDWNKGTNRAVMGATLNKATLEELEICVPTLSEQKCVAHKLDKLTTLISLRKKQLEKLDELVKSRFVEMFGGCKDTIALNDLCSIITDGTHQPPKFQKEGIPFIFVSNLSDNKVTYKTEKFISEETYNQLYERTPIQYGDILLSTVGSYGHPAVVVDKRKFLFQRHIAYLKPKSDLVNSFFLHSAILAPDGQRQIEERVKGIAQKTLNLSEIRKIKIPIPSIEEQNAFEDFIKQTDKSKFVAEHSVSLYQSLLTKGAFIYE